MDRIRKYSTEDYATIDSWFTARDLPTPKPAHLPQTGYVAEGVAAGFIYLTDSSVCILDTFISNPKSDDRKRDKALNLITMHLLEFAKASGASLVICSTKSKAIGLRARKFGFHEMSTETCYAREI